VLVCKAHGTLLQVSFCGHHDFVKKLLLVMIIELLNDSIALPFSRGIKTMAPRHGANTTLMRGPMPQGYRLLPQKHLSLST